MIKIIIQDLGTKSPGCTNACRQLKGECRDNNCSLRYRVVFACQHCDAVRCFYGANNPSVCQTCKKPILDMYLMKSDISCNTRVAYHQLEN